LRILEGLGYEADLSINSQRLGVFSSDTWNVSWMLAPRKPYHPDFNQPWKRSESRLWEIPLSCFLVPFTINTGLVFRVRFMKIFFRLLRLESLRFGNPIVYMTHPEDLYALRSSPNGQRLSWRDLIPSKAHGFGFRHWLAETDPEVIARLSSELMQHMRHAMNVRFVTVRKYVAELEGK